MPSYLLLIPAVLSVLAVITGHTRSTGRAFVKTAATLSLFAIVVLHGLNTDSNGFTIPFAVALLFAAAADYVLATQHRAWYFRAGLFGFLIAYGIYGVALHISAGPSLIAAGASVVMLIILIVQYRTLPNLPADLRVPVVVYMIVVSHLVVAGVAYAHAVWSVNPGVAMLAIVAVLGIYISDSFIAHNLFRRQLKNDELWILPSYFAAQICITWMLLLA
ncbi:MAG: lysoplasmalogenase family protein [Spirochaetaceae bacterium]